MVRHHIRRSLASAIVLAALAGVIAVHSIAATAQSVASAVPVSWLFCEEVPVSVSDAIGRDSEARELADDACTLLSRRVVTPWADEDGDDD
jgi:hypothetical protein